MVAPHQSPPGKPRRTGMVSTGVILAARRVGQVEGDQAASPLNHHNSCIEKTPVHLAMTTMSPSRGGGREEDEVGAG